MWQQRKEKAIDCKENMERVGGRKGKKEVI